MLARYVFSQVLNTWSKAINSAAFNDEQGNEGA
jgi:hypothetical protein